MRKVKKIIAFFMVAIIFIPVISNASVMNVKAAKEMGRNTVTIEGNLSNPTSYKKTLEKLLSDDSIDGVYVIDYSKKNDFVDADAMINNSVINQEENVSIQRAITVYRYRITNVTDGNDYTGTKAIAKAVGEPGITISIGKTVSVSNSYSLSADVSGKIGAKTVTASVGYDVSKSESISITGSDKVPSKHAGKKVKNMTLNAYPVYATKDFDVERHKSVGGLNYGWYDYGSGSSKRAYGVYFSKTYKYK